MKKALKIGLALLLLALLVLPTAGLAPREAAAESVIATGIIYDVSSLNVRKTANGTVVGHVNRNTEVNIYAIEGSWLKIEATQDGKTVSGYVAGKYVRLTGDSAKLYALGYTTGKVNLRSSASSANDSNVVGAYKKNSAILITGAATNKWYPVTVVADGKSGYMYANYVAVLSKGGALPTATPVASATPTPSSGSTGVLNASGVNIRKGPSTSYSSLGKLAKGTKVTLSGLSGKWYKVVVDGTKQEGYVYARYITITGTATSTPTSSASTTPVAGLTTGEAVLTSSGVNFRKGPSTSYSSYGKLSKGTKVTIESFSGSWAKVKVTKTGKVGYVYTKFLKMTSTTTGTPAPTVALPTMRPGSPNP